MKPNPMLLIELGDRLGLDFFQTDGPRDYRQENRAAFLLGFGMLTVFFIVLVASTFLISAWITIVGVIAGFVLFMVGYIKALNLISQFYAKR